MASPYDLTSLGTLERRAVEATLAARGAEIDPVPEGKTIRAVVIATHEAFAPDDGFLQFFNLFHRTTRDEILARELLVGPGDLWNAALIEETVRNLRGNELLSSIVVALPLRTADPSRVDLLVVTRDVWSLRLNTDFEVQQGQLIAFTASLAENNLLGWRKSAAMVLSMDQGAIAIGPTYVDPNIAGTRLTLSAQARALFERKVGTLEAGEAEGSWSYTQLSYPLYSLSRRWGGNVHAGHHDQVYRLFSGGRVASVDVFDTPADASDDVPWAYRSRGFGAGGGVTRQFPGRVTQRVTASHEISVRRNLFLDGFPTDPAARDRFATRVFPRAEQASTLSLGYGLFTPRYRKYRDLGTFDLQEDARLGPRLAVSAGRALRALGSDRDFSTVSASAGVATDAGDGFQSLGAAWSGRLDRGELVDQTASASVYLATPVLARTLRLVGSAEGATYLRRTRNYFFTLGGESGLRGYALADFVGPARVLAHAEARTLSLPVWVVRAGALVFWDAGHAADSLSALRLHHDAGVGLRVLIPQLQSTVLRVDWALPFQTTDQTRAGFPGRLSIGFHQVL